MSKDMWYYANREKVLSKMKRFRDNHKELVRQKKRIYYLKHKHGILAEQKKYYQVHRNEILIKAKRYRELIPYEMKVRKNQFYLRNKAIILRNMKLNYPKRREKVLIACKKYRSLHKARHNELSKLYYWRNSELARKKSRELYKKNLTYNRLIKRASEQRRRHAAGVFDRDTIQTLFENNVKKYGSLTCYLCLNKIQFGQDCVEHKIPISRGGTHSMSNLDIAHRVCNIKKRNKTVEEYLTMNTILV